MANYVVSSDDEADLKVVEEKSRESNDRSGPGWGECPMCEQLLPIPELRLHSMACQGIAYNGGEGLVVNPMDVQTRCTVGSFLPTFLLS